MKKIIFLILIFANLSFGTITYNPQMPNVEQEITFNLTHPDGVYPPSVFWDFGDGSTASSNSTVLKSYLTSGNFTVSVNYRTLKEQNVTESITINVTERRRISFFPTNPTVNRDIVFTAESFFSNDILWDFGDGSSPQCLQRQAVHRYDEPGRYRVSAIDWCGKSVASIGTYVNVSEEKGPRAPFKISFIELKFDNGKPYKNVVKDSEDLVAYANIKYEGSGILIAQWEADGVLFKQVQKVLPYAEYTTIDSGKIPSLPTNIVGMHNVTLKIIQPEVEYPIPVIRYYVSLKKEKIEDITIPEIEGKTADGKEVQIKENTINLQKTDYFIIKGKIKNKIKEEIKYAVLRIFLNDKLIQQNIIKDLKEGKDIEFATSILNKKISGGKLYITVYDITTKPPKLIFFERYFLK